MSYFVKFLLFASLAVSPLVANAAKSIKVIGAPGVIKALQAKAPVLEKATDTKIELLDQNPFSAILALKRGLIDAIALGGSQSEYFANPETKKNAPGPEDQYEFLMFSETPLMVVLNPLNPVTSLSRKQITDLLSGKLKTWESITGRKDPVIVAFNRSQTAAVTQVPKFYLGKDEVPDASYATDIPGLARKIKADPGVISFSGSKFESEGVTPKFLESEIKITYSIMAKKPLSPELEKLFAALKK
jgi:hypothetical protein